MCRFCKQSIPEPRITKGESIVGQRRSVVLPGESKTYEGMTVRRYAYYHCPKCGREECTLLVNEKVEKT